MSDAPVVYYKPTCPYAIRLRVQLRFARVRLRWVRFADDPEGAARVRAHHPAGYELSPTVVVDGAYLHNPTVREVRAALAEE